MKENKIIIFFPQIFGNEFLVSLLGSLNSENTFINEYILIYKESLSQNKHLKIISNGIVNFINGFKMNNNSKFIIDEQGKETGLLIKYDNNNKQGLINWTTLKNYFDFPPLIGLQNIGATCYMNATLQCFCHIEKFVYNFKYNLHIIDIANKDNKNLTYSFKSLIEKLWPINYNDPNFNQFNLFI